jgi:hypothetical protein
MEKSMNYYRQIIEQEMNDWRGDILKKENMIARTSKGMQNQARKLMPQKVQDIVTVTIEKFIETVMFGSKYVSIQPGTEGMSLGESDYVVLRQFEKYKNTAVVEGALTGIGGFLVGLADLPALLGIKIKFLYDCAALYGYDVNDPNERLFMLCVFQLAFSSREHRKACLNRVENWDNGGAKEVDWEKLQIEYRDSLDMAKFLQLLPIIGAPVGAIANYDLMNRLKINAMNAYRLRGIRRGL